MNPKKFTLLAIILFSINSSQLYSQVVISSAGGNVNGTGGSVSFSVGQVVSTVNSGTNGYLIQGVQQPYEISVVTTSKEAKDILIQCEAFPNLTTGLVKLQIENLKTGNLKYQLFDMNGKFLTGKNITSKESSIDLSGFATETYLLKIFLDKKTIKTFKIIKIN